MHAWLATEKTREKLRRLHAWLATEKTREKLRRLRERLIDASGQVINHGERINGSALVSRMRLLTPDISKQREYY